MSNPEISHNPGESVENRGPEQIKVQAEALQARLQAAMQQREKDLDNKVASTFTLREQSRQVQENLKEAETALASVNIDMKTTEKAGVDISEEDRKAFDELQSLVEDLRQEAQKIQQQEIALGKQSDVEGRLIDQAEQMDKEAEAKKIEEQALAELTPQAEELAKKLTELVEDFNREKEKVQVYLDTNEHFNKLKDEMFAEAFAIDGGAQNFKARNYSSTEEAREALQAELERTGLFDFKKRKAVKFLISKMGLLDELKTSYEKYQTSHRELYSDNRPVYQEFLGQLEGVVAQAEKAGQAAQQLRGEEYNRLTDKVREKLVSIVQKGFKDPSVERSRVADALEKRVQSVRYRQ